MTESEFRAYVAAHGYDAPEIVERPGGVENEDHTHDFSAAAFILDGEITVITADSAQTCRAGDHFELASGIEHHERYGPAGSKFLIARKHA